MLFNYCSDHFNVKMNSDFSSCWVVHVCMTFFFEIVLVTLIDLRSLDTCANVSMFLSILKKVRGEMTVVIIEVDIVLKIN